MAEAKFVIDGRDYPIPAIDTFNMAECRVLTAYSTLTIDQVGELEGLHPGVVSALMHVGIARANPGMKERDIRAIVDGSNLFEILTKMEAEVDDPPEVSSLTSDSDESTTSGGGASESDGDEHQETNLRAIGSQL